MNELIKKITGQVLDELVPQTWTALGYDQIKEIQYRTAELIVKECVGVCEEYHGTAGDQAAQYIGQGIKEHFGVEE